MEFLFLHPSILKKILHHLEDLRLQSRDFCTVVMVCMKNSDFVSFIKLYPDPKHWITTKAIENLLLNIKLDLNFSLLCSNRPSPANSQCRQIYLCEKRKPQQESSLRIGILLIFLPSRTWAVW